MQVFVNEMISKVRETVVPSRAQSAAINRLQQSFFEGF
uniref:Uncharacterized protein n=1 Tax=uncultured bacterium contig00059 TaxID=1181542 RepID=A0A0A6ZH72_9BACT|nr:hypothetical protein [uncultured bacterium contig00059]